MKDVYKRQVLPGLLQADLAGLPDQVRELQELVALSLIHISSGISSHSSMPPVGMLRRVPRGKCAAMASAVCSRCVFNCRRSRARCRS